VIEIENRIVTDQAASQNASKWSTSYPGVLVRPCANQQLGPESVLVVVGSVKAFDLSGIKLFELGK
jgi:hypothetical protein